MLKWGDSAAGAGIYGVSGKANSYPSGGEGIAVRLCEIAGKAGQAHLTSPLFTADTVTFFVTDIAENPAYSFKVVPGSIYAPVRPYGIHTVVVK